MENYKSPSQDCLEEKKDKLSIDSPNRSYLDNIITAYKASDKVIDMHTHTNYSDGELSPEQLIIHALEKKVGVLAITDHNTIEGLKTIDRKSKII